MQEPSGFTAPPNSSRPPSSPQSRPNSANNRVVNNRVLQRLPADTILASAPDANVQPCSSECHFSNKGAAADMPEPNPGLTEKRPSLTSGEARAGSAGSAAARRAALLEKQRQRDAGFHVLLRPPPAGPLPFSLEAPLIAQPRPISATAALAGLEASVEAGPRRALHAMSQRNRSKVGIYASSLFRAEPHSLRQAQLRAEEEAVAPPAAPPLLPADEEEAAAVAAAAGAPLVGAADENVDVLGCAHPPSGRAPRPLTAYVIGAPPGGSRPRYARQRHWDVSPPPPPSSSSLPGGAAGARSPRPRIASTGASAASRSLDAAHRLATPDVHADGQRHHDDGTTMEMPLAPAPAATAREAEEELRAATGGAPSLSSWMDSLSEAAPAPPQAIDPPRARTTGAPAADPCVTVTLAHTTLGFRGMSFR